MNYGEGLDFWLKTSWTIAREDAVSNGKVSVEKITVPRTMLDMFPELRKVVCKACSNAQLAHEKHIEAALAEWKQNDCNSPKPYIPPGKRW